MSSWMVRNRVPTMTINSASLKAVGARLKDIAPHLQRNLSRKGMKESALVLEAEARRGAPVRTGELRESFETVVKTKQGDLIAEIINTAWYSYLVEYGHAIVGKKPRKRRTGKRVAPKPFMRNALDVRGEAAIDKLTDEVGKVLDKKFPEAGR